MNVCFLKVLEKSWKPTIKFEGLSTIKTNIIISEGKWWRKNKIIVVIYINISELNNLKRVENSAPKWCLISISFICLLETFLSWMFRCFAETNMTWGKLESFRLDFLINLYRKRKLKFFMKFVKISCFSWQRVCLRIHHTYLRKVFLKRFLDNLLIFHSYFHSKTFLNIKK